MNNCKNVKIFEEKQKLLIRRKGLDEVSYRSKIVYCFWIFLTQIKEVQEVRKIADLKLFYDFSMKKSPFQCTLSGF